MNSDRDSSTGDLASFGGGTILGTAASIKKGDVVFHRYKLEKVLGVGGMGVVWLATDEKLDQQVALKFVPDALRHDSDAIQDLKIQTKLGLKLTHENIVRVLGFENDDHLAAIAMEFVDGPTLASMRVDQPSQVFEADSLHVYLLGTLTALEYAHDQAHIVHRDLKPANIMVNSVDRVKVADFGIACSLRNSVSKVMSMPQRTGSGTLHYMSPQQLLGGPGCVADDIYSLGATIFELVTGTPPFHSGDIATQIREIPPSSMTTRRKQNQIEGEPIPDAWEEVIAAALSKDASLRPSNVNEFRKGLLGQPFLRGTGSKGGAQAAHVGQSATVGHAATHSSSRGHRPGFSVAVIASSLTILLLAAVGAVLMLKGPSETIPNKPDLTKEALAAQTKSFNEQQTEAEKFEAESLPAKEKLKLWEHLLSDIRNSDFQTDPAIRKIMQRAEDRMDHWKEEGRAAKMSYTVNVSDLKKAAEDAGKFSEKKDKGAAAKATKWTEVVTKFVPLFRQVDDATDHVAPLEEATKQATTWQTKADAEEPKALPPETLVFVSGPASGWAEYGKKELLKIVQAALAYKGSPGVTTSGGWDVPTFGGLKNWQREKELPITGVLDATTIEALGLQGMPEPKQPPPVVAQTKSSNGSEGGNRTSTQHSSPEASTETNPWAKAVQQRISGGGALPMPGFPFGPR